MKKKDESKGNLYPVSIDMLVEGMEIQEDIYDADAEQLIIAHGTMLGEGGIARIRTLNKGRNIFIAKPLGKLQSYAA